LRTVFANAETYSAKLPAPVDIDMDDGDGTIMGSTTQDGSTPHDTIIEAPNDDLETDSRASQGHCPIVTLRPNFHFTDLANAAYKSTTNANISSDSTWKPTPSSSADDPRRVFTRTELLMWKCAASLWDPLDHLSADPETQKLLAGSRGEAIKAALRKEYVSKWLKETVAYAVEQELSAAQLSSGARIFHLLTGRMIGKAVKEAIANRDFRLSTIISQSGGAGARVLGHQSEGPSRSPPKMSSVFASGKKSVRAASGHGVPGRGNMAESTREDINNQVRIWRKIAQDSNVPEEYMRIWNLLGGDMDSWGQGLVKLPGDWRRRWGLFLWFAEGGGLSLKESVDFFEQYFKKISKPPVPSYLERKLQSDPSLVNCPLPNDVCFELLKLAVEPTYLLEKAIKPNTITPQPLDYRVSWLLWAVLSRAKKVREFSDATGAITLRNPNATTDARALNQSRIDALANTEILGTLMMSSTADRCSMALINALESLGLWQWACFVALFLSNRASRETVIRQILSQWFPLEDSSASCIKNVRAGNLSGDMSELPHEYSEDWDFVVSKLKIPAGWVHEAKALRAKYASDGLQEVVSLIDGNKFVQAYDIVMSTFVPNAIINGLLFTCVMFFTHGD
jgi:hypothetical protein